MPVQPNEVDVIPSNSTLRLAHGPLELKNHQATLDARSDQAAPSQRDRGAPRRADRRRADLLRLLRSKIVLQPVELDGE